MATFLGILLSLTALLLIIVVLIQRGRGGGLAGALGGGGGQSAFGTKAGDLFTKITVGLATFWILLCIVTLRALSASSSKFSNTSTSGQTAPAEPGTGETVPAKTDKSSGTDKSTSGSSDKTGGGDKSSSSTGTAAKTGEATKPATTAPPADSKSSTPPAPAPGK